MSEGKQGPGFLTGFIVTTPKSSSSTPELLWPQSLFTHPKPRGNAAAAMSEKHLELRIERERQEDDNHGEHGGRSPKVQTKISST